MRIRASVFAGIGAATLLLAACHRSEPPPPPENDAMTTPKPVVPPQQPAPQVVELPKAETPKPKPAPEVSPDQQVQDDADATGMTARAARGDDTGDSQPASGGGNEQH